MLPPPGDDDGAVLLEVPDDGDDVLGAALGGADVAVALTAAGVFFPPLPSRRTSATAIPATKPPTGLGDDPTWNGLATSCYQGQMASCDLLFLGTLADPHVAGYHDYADTCAGRRSAGSDQFCTEAFPG